MLKKLPFLIFFVLFCWSSAQETDSLQVEFPAKYKLKLTDTKENMQMKMLEYIPENENWENYSIIVTKLVMKGAVNIPLENVYQSHLKVTQDKTENLIVKELSENNEGERQSKLFTMESEAYRDSAAPESQIYYFVKGEKDIIMCIVALKTKKLPLEFVEEWSKIFLNSRIIK